MGGFGTQPWHWIVGIVTACFAAMGIILAPASIKTKIGRALAKLRWWWLAVALGVLAWVFLFGLPRRWMPPEKFAPSALPEAFHPGYWQWMFLFLLGALACGFGVFMQLRTARRSAGIDPETGRYPDVDAAWDDVMARLAQAKIDVASQRFYLLISPTEDASALFLESAGLQVFAQGPAGPAPLHAFATSDGVFLSLAGACRLGAPSDDRATGRLEHLSRRLLALRPDCPVVRGVVVLFPMDWCAKTESTRDAAAVRDDLQTIARVVGVQCPVFAVFVGMEGVPGFSDFVGRMATQSSPQMLDQRVGFAVPRSHEFSGDLVQRGLVWQSGWFHMWLLNFMAGDPLEHRGNAELATLDSEFRRYRRRLRSIMESAFSTHQGAGPILFRGCYFVASGTRRNERAFSAGLLRGARSRIVADHVVCGWSPEASRADRRYFWSAVGVGIIGGACCSAVWLFIGSRWFTLGWGGLLTLLVVWVLSILWMARR